MTAVEKLLKVARAEIGYLEKATNAYLDDKTANAGHNSFNKYARDLDTTNLYNGKKNGYHWCFTAGTLILTSEGYKPIENVQQGDLLLNAYGDRLNTVTEISAHKAEVMNVSVYGAVSFSVTKDHPFLSKKRKSKWHRKKGYHSYQFNKIGELQEKDVLAVPKTPKMIETSLSDDEIWALGYYVGDGYHSRNKYVLCGNDNKIKEVEKHINIIPELKEYASRTCKEVTIDLNAHPLMKSGLDDCGVGALHKRVPLTILYGSNHMKKVFLEGYLSSDGFCLDNNRRGFSTVSKELATGISRILMDLGFGCAIVENHRPTIGQIFDKRLNSIRTFNQQEIIYVCYINTSSDPANRIYIPEDDMTFVPIRKINKESREDIVYTITTDGDHTYTANNLAVHNCDMFTDWCFVTAFGYEMGLKLTCQVEKGGGAGCTYSARYYRNKGQFHTSNPQPGDQIFFTKDGGKNFYHTGIVEKVTADRIYTIEGNTSSLPGVVENGGAVRDKSYKKTYAYIGGFGRPDWSLVEGKITNTLYTFNIASPSITKPALTYNPTKSGTIVNGSVINVRSGPSTSYDRLGTITKGSNITVTGIDSTKKWYNFKNDKFENAWISGAYVSITTASANTSSTTQVASKTGVVTPLLGVNVRSGPGTNYTKLGALVKGTVVTIIGSSANGKWYNIKTTKYTNGWVNAAYVKIATTSSSTNKKATTANLHLRAGRGTNYKSLGVIPKGTVVEVSNLSNGWYKVKYKNLTGYSSANYLK